MSFQKSCYYDHIKLLTFCLPFQEFQIPSTNCQLLGAFSHSEPVKEKKKIQSKKHSNKNKQTENPQTHTTTFKALLNILQPCIQQRRTEAIQPLEFNTNQVNKLNFVISNFIILSQQLYPAHIHTVHTVLQSFYFQLNDRDSSVILGPSGPAH